MGTPVIKWQEMQRVLPLSHPFQSGIGEILGKRRWEQNPILEGAAGRHWGVPRRWERQQRALHGQAGAATSFEIMPVTYSVTRLPPWLFRPGSSPYTKHTFHPPSKHVSVRRAVQGNQTCPGATDQPCSAAPWWFPHGDVLQFRPLMCAPKKLSLKDIEEPSVPQRPTFCCYLLILRAYEKWWPGCIDWFNIFTLWNTQFFMRLLNVTLK